MAQGITLIAIGRYGYLQWAINLAVSLKYHSPGAPVQLITSGALLPDAQLAQSRYGIFDILTPVADEAFMQDGKLFPAKLKTRFYHYLAFDETIYLDVDGCMINDITPLFNTAAPFASDVQGTFKLSYGAHFNQMKWARPDVVWWHFGLPAMATLPALNSSFMFIRKGPVCETIFDTAHYLLMHNPLPVAQHWHPWGNSRKTKINQPDELYFNVALAELDILPQHIPALHFRLTTETGEPVPVPELAKTYYGIGLFGELRINHLSLREHYNKHMRHTWQQIVTAKTGEPFSAKCEILSQSKFVIQ